MTRGLRRPAGFKVGEQDAAGSPKRLILR